MTRLSITMPLLSHEKILGPVRSTDLDQRKLPLTHACISPSGWLCQNIDRWFRCGNSLAIQRMVHQKLARPHFSLSLCLSTVHVRFTLRYFRPQRSGSSRSRHPCFPNRFVSQPSRSLALSRRNSTFSPQSMWCVSSFSSAQSSPLGSLASIL